MNESSDIIPEFCMAIMDGCECVDGCQYFRQKQPSPMFCTSCDGSGTVHRADGEYLGECSCKGLSIPVNKTEVQDGLEIQQQGGTGTT